MYSKGLVPFRGKTCRFGRVLLQRSSSREPKSPTCQTGLVAQSCVQDSRPDARARTGERVVIFHVTSLH